jgi:signal transduction histidine kinase
MKLFILLFLFFNSVAYPQSTEEEIIKVENDFEYFIEAENEPLTLKEFLTKPLLSKEGNSFGFQKNPIWIKKSIEIKNKKEDKVFVFDFAPLDNIHCYLLDNKLNVILEKETGDNIPFNKSRDIKYRLSNFIVKSETLAHQRDDHYVLVYKIKTSGSTVVSLNILGAKEFNDTTTEDYLFGGFYFGGIILIAVYNLFVFLYIKEIKYFYYITYLVFLLLSQTTLNGYFFQYIAPNSPGLDGFCLIIFLCFVGISLTLFIADYLNLKGISKKLCLSYTIACFTILAAVPFFEYKILIRVIGTVMFIGFAVLIFVSLYSHFVDKNRQAKYLIFAFVYFILGSLFFTLSTFGFIAVNVFTTNAVQIGNIMEALLMSLGLANRIQNLREQSEKLNENLKHEVMVRTIEISAQKEQIEKNYIELKNSKENLSKVERESATNQIAAYLAHEVNNPLNFISLSTMIIKENLQKLKQEILNVLDDSEESKIFAKKIDDILKETLEGNDLGINGTKKILEIIAEISAITGVDGIHIDSCNIIEIILLSVEEMMKKNQINSNRLEVFLNEVPITPLVSFEPKYMLSQKIILTRVLRTVINNAIFFSLKTTTSVPQIKINTKEITKNDDAIFIISIKNNGPPIRVGKEKGLFELQNKSSYGSELIGLSMVRELMKKIQGNLSLVDNGYKSGWVEFQIIVNDYK